MTSFKTYLEGRGEKQNDFAKRIGISAAYLSQILSGDRTPSLELAVAIEDATCGAVTARSWVVQQEATQ